MRNVKIVPNGIGGMSIIVDGVDVSGFVNRDGMVIEFKDGRAHVWLPVNPVMLVGQFPEAVVNALRGSEAPAVTPTRLKEWAAELGAALWGHNWVVVRAVQEALAEAAGQA